MIKNKWIIVHLILSTYNIIFAVNTNGNGILFGKIIIGLDGMRFVPVYL